MLPRGPQRQTFSLVLCVKRQRVTPAFICAPTRSYCLWGPALCPASSKPVSTLRSQCNSHPQLRNILRVREGAGESPRGPLLGLASLRCSHCGGQVRGCWETQRERPPCACQRCPDQKAACPERGRYSPAAVGAVGWRHCPWAQEDLVCPPKGLAFCLINGSGDGKNNLKITVVKDWEHG